jgi:hypothetical protein
MAKGQKTGGRQKGTPNKVSALLKDAILEAAEIAGDKEGLVGYLTQQAHDNPAAFLTLLGKVLPMQVTGEDGGPLRVTRIERVIVSPPHSDNTGKEQRLPN